MAFTGTPAAEALEAIVRLLFDGRFIRIGQYNRRKIAGSNTWSQHSWGNALDIHVSVGVATGVAKANGDAIAEFLEQNKFQFGIRYILWWRTNHYDHIHVDMWPKGIGIPPEEPTGLGYFRYSDNRSVRERIQEVPAEGDFSEYEWEEAQVKELVTFLQEALVEAGYDPGPIDGILGPMTKAALVAAFEGDSAEGDRANLRLDALKESI